MSVQQVGDAVIAHLQDVLASRQDPTSAMRLASGIWMMHVTRFVCRPVSKGRHGCQCECTSSAGWP